MLTSNSLEKYISSLGLETNPFEYTNADQEDRLPEYFVPPLYFETAFGNPKEPKSYVIFAPRGGGKTAQRRIMEYNSADRDVLAITYDQFEFPEVNTASEIRVHHHLRKIIQSVLVGLLIDINAEPSLRLALDKNQKETLLHISAEHLPGITQVELNRTLNSLKGLKQKFREFWNEWLPITNVSVKLLTRVIKPLYEINDLGELSKFENDEFKKASSLKYQLSLLAKISKTLGWKAIYVLVDRVDESELTGNNVKNSFAIVEPLLKDLHLLELPGVAFKFFLWDLLEPLCEGVLRTDRIQTGSLHWTEDMLTELWQKRLKAYSRGKLGSLNPKSQATKPYPVDKLAMLFANQSPRDLIRIGGRIISEAQEIKPSGGDIPAEAVYKGIERFCSDKAIELIRNTRVLKELKKIRQVDFTIPYLANDIFREKQTSTRNRMRFWREEAAIVEVELVENPNSLQTRPVKLFAIRDIRIAKEMFPELTIPEFLHRKFKKCSSCGATLLRDWGDQDSSNSCHECQADITSDETTETWKRQEIAKENRKQYNRDTIDPSQLLLFQFEETEAAVKAD